MSNVLIFILYLHMTDARYNDANGAPSEVSLVAGVYLSDAGCKQGMAAYKQTAAKTATFTCSSRYASP
jgi:hypothetical protein